MEFDLKINGKRVRKTLQSIEDYGTECCALVQIACTNSVKKPHLEFLINKTREKIEEEIKQFAEYNDADNDDDNILEPDAEVPRAYFVIARENEPELVAILEELGFVKGASFPRKTCYPEGLNTLYTIIL